MSTITVFRDLNASSADTVFVGVPDEIQLDNSISAIELTQVEILPTPTTIEELLVTPLEIANSAVSAFANVQASTLQPGFELRASISGAFSHMTSPLDVQEVIIPPGYVHIDDLDNWNIYNYNLAFLNTPQEFRPLPGQNRIPVTTTYDVQILNRTFECTHSSAIDRIRIYYRRLVPELLQVAVNENEQIIEYEWTAWEYIDNEKKVDFPYDGDYIFRFVPVFEGKPLPEGYKEVQRGWEANTQLQWSDTQVRPLEYKIRMAGEVDPKVNFVQVYEKRASLPQDPYKLVKSQFLYPDENGKVDLDFMVKLSDLPKEWKPRLEYRFYHKSKNGTMHYINKSEHILEKHFTDEPIVLQVEKNPSDASLFRITIKDQTKVGFYRPASEIGWDQGDRWEDAIERGEIICRLNIRRHQSGEVKPYGQYIVNHAQGRTPVFVDGAPFRELRVLDNGFEFIFQDDSDFRRVNDLDNPDFDKTLMYEFRLCVWSAGVEHALRTGQEYWYNFDEEITTEQGTETHRHYVNTWQRDHPMRKYRGIMPLKREKSIYRNHLKYGTMKNSISLVSIPLTPTRTRNIDVQSGNWKVLYYYNSEDDEIQEFPFYSFSINIPYTSRQEIEEIKVYVEAAAPKEDQLIGVFHPSEIIEIVDFYGYFLSVRHITTQTPFNSVARNNGGQGINQIVSQPSYTANASSTLARLNSSSSRVATTSSPTMPNATGTSESLASPTIYGTAPAPSMVSATTSGVAAIGNISATVTPFESVNSNRAVNNAIARIAETGTVNYRIDVKFRDGFVAVETLSVPISERPKIPEDPVNNSSVGIGNRSFLDSTVQLSSSAAEQVIQVVGQGTSGALISTSGAGTTSTSTSATVGSFSIAATGAAVTTLS